MYYTQSTVCKSGSYERNSSNIFHSSSPWAYVGFAKGELNFFGGMGKLHAAKRIATRCIAKRLLRRFRGMLPREIFLNYATWCVLEHIFINFLLEKIKNIYFLYKNNDKL